MKEKKPVSIAYLAGLTVQALGLAVGVAAVLIQLLRASNELAFRYGGF